MSASSSVRPSRSRGSCSCGPICRATPAFRPRLPIASRCRGGPCFAPAGHRSRWSSTSWRPWPACTSITARSGSIRPEMPGCDGSAQAFVAAIQQAGIVEQEAPRELFVVRQVLRLGNEECWIEARPAAGGKTVIQYELDYGSGNPIGRQSLEVTLSPRYFHVSLASSRTFMLQREAAALQAQGLGQRTTFNDLLGVRRGRPDRQRAAVPRRVRPSQDSRYGRRLRPGRLRSGRTFRRLPQRTSPQRRVGAGDAGKFRCLETVCLDCRTCRDAVIPARTDR